MKELLSEAIRISLSDPMIFAQAFGLTLILIFGVSLNFMKKSRRRKFPTRVEPKPKRVLKLDFRHFSIFKFFKWWKQLGTRLLNFEIESFYIPHYRDEWGKYKYWDFQKPQRPKKVRDKKTINKLSLPEDVPDEYIEEPVNQEESGGIEYVPHDHSQCERVIINVSGLTFETQLRTLNRFPKTILGDPIKRARFYNAQSNEYFFDRHRASFQAIMYYYQSGGVLRCPYGVNLDVFFEELDFFEIDEDVINKLKESEGLAVEDDKDIPTNMLIRKLWLLMEYPESSLQAKVVAIISIFVITISIFTFCVETMTEFAYNLDSKIADSDEITEEEDASIYDLRDPIFLLETVCICWFVFEILMRIITCPDLFDFCVDMMNIIDLVAILPYFLSVATYLASSDTVPKGFDPGSNIIRPQSKGESKASKGNSRASLAIFRVIRLVRVFRIFKLSRHFKGLKILGKTLKASVRELFMLVFFLTIGVVLFSSAVYFLEIGVSGTKFTSIPEGFWWAVITMTTVGYGDIIPLGTYGRIIGCACAIAGVLTISLPVPVIVSNFNTFYQRESYMGQLEAQDSDDGLVWRITYLHQCPNRSGLAYLEPEEKPHKKLLKKRRRRQLKPENMWEAMKGMEESDSDEEFQPLKFRNRKPPTGNQRKWL